VSEDRGHGAVRGTGEDDGGDPIDVGFTTGEDAGQGGPRHDRTDYGRRGRQGHKESPTA
jgi:hypothetical protein